MIGALISAVGGIVSSALNAMSADKANKTNAEYADKNIELQKEQLQYQKYLNNNQIQMQAADAMKAGINPLALHSGQLSSGSYSNVNAGQQSSDFSSISSALSGIGNSIVDSYTQKGIAKENNQTSKDVASANAKSALDVQNARDNAEMERTQEQNKSQELQTYMKILADKGMKADEIAESARQFNEKNNEDIRHNKAIESLTDKSLTETERHNLAVEKLDRFKNDFMLQSQWTKDAQTNSLLSKQRELMDAQIKDYESAIAQRKWERADMIMNQINNTARTIISVVNPLVNLDSYLSSSYMSSRPHNKIGF